MLDVGHLFTGHAAILVNRRLETSFYRADFWFLWDLGIILLGAGFMVLRIVGLRTHSFELIDTAFDLLALEALLLIPRYVRPIISKRAKRPRRAANDVSGVLKNTLGLAPC